jgi:signal transduction histidine kinase
MRRRRRSTGRFREQMLRRRVARAEARARAAEERLAGVRENLRLLEKAKRDFLDLVAHELRTPLTTILGGLGILDSVLADVTIDRPVLSPEDVDRLQTVRQAVARSGDRLSHFLCETLVMAALQGVDRRLDLTMTPVAALVEAALALPRERAARTGLRLDDELGDAAWSLLCDAGLIRQALDRLLDNAIVYNRAGGEIRIREVDAVPQHGSAADLVTAEGRRRLTSQPTFAFWNRDEVRWRLIEIFNTGPEIPADRRATLVRGFTGAGRIAHHQQGAGLGLAIARGAVELHGGRLLLEAVPDRGNAVYLLLPALDDEPSALAGPTADSLTGALEGASTDAPASVSAGPRAGSVDQPRNRVDGAARNEQVRERCDAARFEVELHDPRTAVSRDLR